MPRSSRHKSIDPSVIQQCSERRHFNCSGSIIYSEFKDEWYCVLHFPHKEQLEVREAFEEIKEKKIKAKDFNFRGACFPYEVSFRGRHFKEQVDFSETVFLQDVNFSGAYFNKKANFHKAFFFNDTVDFSNATFRDTVDFSQAKSHCTNIFRGSAFLKDVDFSSISFEQNTDFRNTSFKAKADFNSAKFYGNVWFAGDEEGHVFGDNTSFDFQFTTIARPDLISFHTFTLLPHWFVNVDVRRFNFTNVKWHDSIPQEINNLVIKQISSPYHLLSITCRQLALNAEENHRYEEASMFRYMSLDVRRRETLRGYALWTLRWWYWAASGYGERAARAFLVLIVIWVFFAFTYMQASFASWDTISMNDNNAIKSTNELVWKPLNFPRALTYSLGVMTLQKPEPRPATNTTQTIILLETILGPTQAALLALAIRRKFIR